MDSPVQNRIWDVVVEILKGLLIVSLYTISTILAFLLMRQVDIALGLGLSGPVGIGHLGLIIGFLVALIFFRGFRSSFSKHFIREKKLFFVIGISVLLGIIMQLTLSFIKIFVLWLGFDIPVGSGQYISDGRLTAAGEGFLVYLIGPFLEEAYYRYGLFMGLLGLFVLLDFLKGKSSLINKIYDGSERKKRIWICLWVLGSSVYFAVYHGVNMMNIWFYLIPGVIYGVLFLKYGFLASWISHSMFNIVSKDVYRMLLRVFGM
ncbi:CPBP family intramembrane glutamic endopeptidase [Bacillus wiedmannii]|uniref:CPBP family intramembrane glutamic endopeptidase n=1 Tax=Bacillus wiedmannii TaxID=1890302 RepID=UPI000BF3FDD4|nr:CPBP family intramembrane glutamic endopeptidase [Bacillus wiedmannii]PFY98359.1 CPBP family intramembrane metalloprotease [Bacillus wiedmannii]